MNFLPLCLATALCAVIAGLPPTSAFAQPTQLDIKRSENYVHQHSGTEFLAVIPGYKRDYVGEFFPNELDVVMQYTSKDESSYISIYIYRNTNADVSVWFDRARAGIEKRNSFGRTSIASKPTAFAIPGMENPQAMRVTFATEDSDFTATGLALLPINDWYVKIRVSSKNQTPAEIDATIDGILTGIAFPALETQHTTPETIAACEESLVFEGGAEPLQVKKDRLLISSVLDEMSALFLESSKTEGEPINWCRDDGHDLQPSAIYRRDQSTDYYLLARGDSGRAFSTGNSLTGVLLSDTKGGAPDDGGKSDTPKTFSVAFHSPESRLSFRERDRLPSPDELTHIIMSERPTSKSNVFGEEDQINIFPSAED